MARSLVLDATAGLLAAAVALGVAELVATFTGSASPVIAVGDVVVDYTPGRLVKAAIETLGTNDKPALIVSVVVASLSIGALVGPLAGRRREAGVTALGAFGAIAAIAGARDPQTSSLDAVLVATVAAVSGMVALAMLLRAASPSDTSTRVVMPGTGVADRRRFLTFAAGAAATAVGTAFIGPRVLGPRVDVEAQRRSVVLPPVAVTATPETRVAATASPTVESRAIPEPDFDVPDLSPLITPNGEFYRIDTALSVPRVDTERWRLRVTGMVDRPYELTFEELLAMSAIEEPVTLVCVSNSVGGDLVGNAIWRGIPLAAILTRAGVQQGATQVVGRSVDGFTVGFPTDVALDGRPAMVAVGMNGEPLPVVHGFPARLIVAGLYGYVSATKWLTEIELTTLEAFDAYWVPRGWAKQAPIKTQSRIDRPRRLKAGPTVVAGVAWGGIRSISRVEVRIRLTDEDEEGEWREARLGEALSASTWRQWVIDWDATPGAYRAEVRATDGEGNVQTEERQGKAPDGATGYHAIWINVE